jgi:drug/metabolite transporter (DMT)-like permease
MAAEEQRAVLFGGRAGRLSLPPERARQVKADLSLLLVAAIWGTTFVLVKEATQSIPPYTFIALRFTIGFAALALLFHKRLRRANRQEIKAGLIIAIFLYGGFITQTLSLQTTAASITAFITGLCTVMVPLIAFALLRHRPATGSLAGVALATVGMGLLTIKDGLSLAQGDVLALMCAVFFALHIVMIAKYAPTLDPTVLAVVQIGAVAAAGWPIALLIEQPSLAVPPHVWANVAFVGLAATGLVFFIQNLAQRFTSPTHTAVIFTMEPVFAAFFAYLWLAELVTGRGMIGAVLILAGMLVAELWRPANGQAKPHGPAPTL